MRIKNEPASLNDPLTVVGIAARGKRQRIQCIQRPGDVAKARGVQRGPFFGEKYARIILQIGRGYAQVSLANDAARVPAVAVADTVNGQREIPSALDQPAAVVVQTLCRDGKIALGDNHPFLVGDPGGVYPRIFTGYQCALRIFQRPHMQIQRTCGAQGTVAVVHVRGRYDGFFRAGQHAVLIADAAGVDVQGAKADDAAGRQGRVV